MTPEAPSGPFEPDPGDGDTESESVEIENTLPNAYVIRDGDTRRFVPRTTESKLFYEHEFLELFENSPDGEPLTLSEEPYLAVMPTENERVYVLWNGDGPPARNPPSETERVLSAVLSIEEGRGTNSFERLYRDLRATQARPDQMNRVREQYAPVPTTSVVPEDAGWVIEGMFLLTWATNIYLITQDYNQRAYRIGHALSDNTVETMSDEPEVLTLEPELPEHSLTIPLADENGSEQVTLSERELMFLTKASWLVNYRENYDDDVFWNQIERYVRRESLSS